ncbi:hypothetical protein [Thiohalobacter thiocyanaticus]|nr:hypothetical protein [Thiohalobacter thiocyanaticus]
MAIWRAAVLASVFTAVGLGQLFVYSDAHARQESDKAVEEREQAAGAETRSPRLRFRSGGPACMCLSGLSEADIQAAQSRQEGGAEKLESIIQD